MLLGRCEAVAVKAKKQEQKGREKMGKAEEKEVARASSSTRSTREVSVDETNEDPKFGWQWKDPRKEVGRTIQFWRHQLGWSQRKLAERAGTSQNHIYLLENGKTDATISTLQKL